VTMLRERDARKRELEQWYARHYATHAHCKFECEHPQPFVWRGVLYCGRCWFVDKILTRMTPCQCE
jgi:hypothetical protein